MSNKYRNIKTVVNGITFDSKAEAKRYNELLLLEKAGEISHLILQPKFLITVNEMKVCTYIADFQYHELASNEVIVEDVKRKATATPVYKLKKKLMFAVHGINIVEV